MLDLPGLLGMARLQQVSGDIQAMTDPYCPACKLNELQEKLMSMRLPSSAALTAKPDHWAMVTTTAEMCERLLKIRNELNEITHRIFGHALVEPRPEGPTPEEVESSGLLPQLKYELGRMNGLVHDVAGVVNALGNEMQPLNTKVPHD